MAWRRPLRTLGLIVVVGVDASVAIAAPRFVVPLPVARPVFETIPLPVPRPADLMRSAAPPPDAAPPAATVPPPPPTPLPSDAAAVDICRALLEGGTILGARVPPVHDAGGCGIDEPIRLEAIKMPDADDVKLTPPPVMRCDMARALADWVRRDVAATLEPLKTPLVRLETADAYSCRGRNRVVGAKLSEHARGNAIDISHFVLGDGRRLAISPANDPKAVMTALRDTACGKFSTVLGPGSDGYHETHMHIDLAPRRSAAHYCHWQIAP